MKIIFIAIIIIAFVIASGCSASAQDSSGGYRVDGGGAMPARYYYPDENVMCHVSNGISCLKMPDEYHP